MVDFDYAAALSDNIATLILLLLALVAGWVVFTLNKPPAKDAPVKVPIGIIESMNRLVASEAPWWHLQLRESLGSSIFQHNIPAPGGMYVICSAKDQREVLLDTTSDKPLHLYSSFDSIVGHKHIFTRSTTDPLLKEAKKSIVHAFSSSEIKRMNAICTKCIKEWEADFLEKIADTDATFDPSIELPKVVFKSIVEAAFEYEATPEDFELFTSNFDIAVREIAFRQAVNPLRKLFSFMIPKVWEARKCCSVMQNFAKKVLEAYRNNPNKSECNTLIKIVETKLNHFSEQHKTAELLSLIVAGFDSTGYTLANTLVLLAKHPEEMKRLQQSLLQDDPAQSNDHLKRVITESQRVIPVGAMGSVRLINRDFILFDELSNRKVKVPKGAAVFLPQITSHRDEMVFKDAEQFKPDRWENPTKEMVQSFIPFAVGKRTCPGQSLANAELFSVLSSILSKYEFELVTEGTLEVFMTMKYANTKLRAKRVKA
uniref:Cytochrome P450 n=1 Tax=Craspedostauros australis TaxID=1486917 RepID=A0A7R9WVQ4_9STRA|mmetsp:Transcript_21785/g.60632  ORF Transcript_21785/g.60632 Transcript_21785/m.60632 type:complete len:485 (+) Transcript_21785:818-2272(+)